MWANFTEWGTVYFIAQNVHEEIISYWIVKEVYKWINELLIETHCKWWSIHNSRYEMNKVFKNKKDCLLYHIDKLKAEIIEEESEIAIHHDTMNDLDRVINSYKQLILINKQ